MKIRIDANVFSQMVQSAANAISARPTNPAYECVYLEARDGTLSATAQDGGVCIRKTTSQALIEEDGNAIIPAKTILGFIKLLYGDVILTVNKNRAELVCGRNKASIVCMDAESGFPELPEQKNAKTVIMRSEDFNRLYRDVKHCIGTDQGRVVLTGVNFSFDANEDKCEAVAMDGFRVAISKAKAETNDTFSAVVPNDAVSLISKTIDDEHATFTFGTGQLLVESGDTAMAVPLLSGDYVDYNKLLPKISEMKVRFNVAEAIESVKVTMVSAQSDKKNLIVLRFGDDVMQIFARNDRNDAISETQIDRHGEMQNGDEIAFNCKFILEALNVIKPYADEAELSLNTSVSPMVILPLDCKEDIYQLILPVRRNA